MVMTVTDAKVSRDVVRRFHEEALAAGDPHTVDELVASDCVMTNNDLTVRGRRMLKDSAAELLAGFPDTQLVLDQIEGTETGALVRWHADGTHLGWYAGIEETGIPVSYWGVSVYLIDNARITRAWTASTFPEALAGIREAAGRQKGLS